MQFETSRKPKHVEGIRFIEYHNKFGYTVAVVESQHSSFRENPTWCGDRKTFETRYRNQEKEGTPNEVTKAILHWWPKSDVGA